MSAYGVDPTEDVAGPLPSGGADPSRALMTPAQVSAAEIMPGPAGLDINPQAPVGAPIPAAVGPGVPALEAVPADPTTVGFDPLPAVPTRPLPTGDIQQDIANDIDYRQRLTTHQGLILQRQGELGKLAAAANLSGAQKQLRVDQAQEAARVKENEDYQKTRASRSDAIDQTVARKAAAEADLTKGYWADKGTGDKVWAAVMLALGGIGQATAARSAARLGQVSNAQNQGLVALNRLMDEDYKRKQANVAAAKDDVLEARYGFKDAADNHRAALNDIDADRAAKWRTVATETAAELARRGADQAQINADQTYLLARQKEADATESIHERQDARELQEKHYKAMETQARAQLGLGYAGLALREKTATTEADKEAKEARGRASHALDKLPSEFQKRLNQEGVTVGQGGAKGLLPTNRTLVKLLAAIDSDNPLAAKEAFLAFDSAARGGTATQGSVDALTKTLGGSYTQFQNWLESKKSGGLSKDSKDRFRAAVVESLHSNLDAANTGHENMVEAFYAPDYAPLKQQVESQMSVFQGFKDENGKQVFKLKRDPNAKGINRATGKDLPTRRENAVRNASPADLDAIDWLTDHPNDEGADGVRAKLEAKGIL